MSKYHGSELRWGNTFNKGNVKWCLRAVAELSRGPTLPKAETSLGSLQLRIQFTTSLGCFSFAAFLSFPCDFPFLLPNTLSFLDAICFRIRSRSLFPSPSGPLWGLMFSPQRAALPALTHGLVGRKAVAELKYSQEPSRDILLGLEVLKNKIKPSKLEDLIGFI